MSAYPRYSTHHLRQPSAPPSASNAASAAQQPPALVARINEKKQELESLLALRDLSGALATQMQQLEAKLATLADGTEAVATVLANWNNVLRAIAMASTKIPKPKSAAEDDPFTTPAAEKDEFEGFPKNENGVAMPQTLVRIPVQEQQK